MAQLHIPEPCPKGWQNMSPNSDGRWCTTCSKTVVDFTRMNNREITNYLQQKNSEVCGHFYAHQVAAPGKNRTRWIAAFFTFLFGASLLSSCWRHVEGRVSAYSSPPKDPKPKKQEAKHHQK